MTRTPKHLTHPNRPSFRNLLSPGAAALAAGLALSALAPGALAGPPGDYGDAPVGNNGDGIVAYNGVLARWVSFYTHKNTVFQPTRSRGTWTDAGANFRLGTVAPPVKLDTAQNPTSPDLDANPVFFLQAMGPNPLGRLEIKVSADASYNPNDPVYLNVLIDQNRDGQWKDGFLVGTQLFAWNMEWAVQDLELHLTPGDETEVGISNIRLEDPTADHWIRLVLTDRPVGQLNKALPAVPGSATFWDGSMVDASSQAWVGEIEDHLLTPGGSNPNFPGVLNPNIILLPGDPPPNPKPRCIIGFEGLDTGAGNTRRLATPWCKDGKRLFAWDFSSADVLGGCDNGNANALVGLYGPKLLAGAGMPPNFDGLNGVVGPLVCPDGTNLDLPLQAGTGYPLFDEGTYTINQLDAGIADRVCYPDPRKFRLYGVKVRVETCGSEYQSYSVVPTANALSAPTIEAGTDMIAMFFAGDLIQEFQTLDPDHFTDWTFLPLGPAGEVRIDTDVFAEGGSSLRMTEALYRVAPNLDNIPPDGLRPEVDLSFLQLGSVRFQHLGSEGVARLVGEDGTSFEMFIEPSLSGFQEVIVPVPDGFAVREVLIEMPDGWIDELEVDVIERTNDDVPPCPADLTGSSDPNDPTYGIPDGDADGDDFFFYLDAFSGGDLAICDLTGSSDPNDPSYGSPDGDCDGDDFFLYLDLFAAGCDG